MIIKNPIFGNYIEKKTSSSALSDISIDFIVPLELVSRWQRCGLVADFMARYESFKFKNRKKAEHLLSTVVNELLENAVKFSSDQNKLVNLRLRHFNNKIIVKTINVANRKQTKKLDHFINKLKNRDLEDLLIKQIEYTNKKARDRSELGLITLLKDYQAQLGIKIQPRNNRHEEFDIFVKITLQTADIKKTVKN